MYSIRRRLLLVLAGGFTVLIAVAGGWLAGELRARLTGEFDAALLAKARALAALTDQENGVIEFDYSPAAMPEFERSSDPELFQFWLDDGVVLLRSARLEGDLPHGAPAAGEPAFGDATLRDGRAGRVVQLAFVPARHADTGDADEDAAAPGPQRGLVLAVARNRASLDRLLAGIDLALFGGGGLAVALAILLVWRALAVGLRPLDAVAARVETLDAERLHARIELPRTPRELAPIVQQLNALLERLDASFERERRFAANVAHELRTPIAELRSLAMVGARWPDDRESVAAFFDDVRAVAGRMEGVIGDLLLLARCQAGVEQIARQPVSLQRLVHSIWAKLAECAARNRLHRALDLREDIVVETDPGKLEIVLANLIGNAVNHARPDSEVRCSAVRTGSGFRLEISNAAERLEPHELERLGEPFWRKDDARASAEHAGLGLALVDALAGLLGLRIRYAQDPDETFRAVLEGAAQAAARFGRPA
jgi:signal transduction histidine kinase